MPSSEHDLIGRELRDSGNRPVGKVTAVYRYPADLHAPWGATAVTHGLILKSTHLVDLQDADLDQETVQVPHTSHTINTAPSYSPIIGDMLADHHAATVRAHYWGAAQPV
jgi:hypothetical protein